MFNPSDKELDRLSREAAEQFEPDEIISSWDKLASRLDFEIGVRPTSSFGRFTRGPIPIIAGIILMSSLVYFAWNRLSHSTSITKNIAHQSTSTLPAQVSTNTDQKTNAAESNAAKKDDNKDNGLAQPGQANDQSSLSGVGGQKSGNSVPAASLKTDPNRVAANDGQTHQGLQPNIPSNSQSGNAVNRTSKSGSSHGSISGNVDKSSEGLANPGLENGKTNAASVDLAANPSGINAANGNPVSGSKKGIAKTDNGLKYAELPAAAFMAGQFSGVNDASIRNYKPAAANSTSVVNPQKSNSKGLYLNRSLKIGLLFAPDITSVNTTSPEKLSSNFGLTLGYDIYKGLSINTGVIYTKKNYSAAGRDFHDFPYYGHLDYLTGSCNMFEIPLTLRYDFPSPNRTLFFVNAGLSSYLMKHEDYTYYVHYDYWGTQVPGQLSKSYESNSNYLFSVLSISAGVEHRFSKNLSLQVEPFIKVPLTGVGVGNLQLSSYGIAFSLRYAPLLKKSRAAQPTAPMVKQ